VHRRITPSECCTAMDWILRLCSTFTVRLSSLTSRMPPAHGTASPRRLNVSASTQWWTAPDALGTTRLMHRRLETCATLRMMSYSARHVSGRITCYTLCYCRYLPRHNDKTSGNNHTLSNCLSIRLSCLIQTFWYACCTRTLINSSFTHVFSLLLACVMSSLLINEHCDCDCDCDQKCWGVSFSRLSKLKLHITPYLSNFLFLPSFRSFCHLPFLTSYKFLTLIIFAYPFSMQLFWIYGTPRLCPLIQHLFLTVL